MFWFAIWTFFTQEKTARGRWKVTLVHQTGRMTFAPNAFGLSKSTLNLQNPVFIAGYCSVKNPLRVEWVRQFGTISGLNDNDNMLCSILNSKSIMSQQSILTTQNSCYKFWRKCDRTNKVKMNLKAESKTSDSSGRCDPLTGRVCVEGSVIGSKTPESCLTEINLEKRPICWFFADLVFTVYIHPLALASWHFLNTTKHKSAAEADGKVKWTN